MVTTRGGKSTQEPPFPQDAGKQRKTVTASSTEVEDEEQEEAVDSNTPVTQEDSVEPPRTHGTITTQLPYRFRSG